MLARRGTLLFNLQSEAIPLQRHYNHRRAPFLEDECLPRFSADDNGKAHLM